MDQKVHTKAGVSLESFGVDVVERETLFEEIGGRMALSGVAAYLEKRLGLTDRLRHATIEQAKDG
jgi:hypothetical protein